MSDFTCPVCCGPVRNVAPTTTASDASAQQWSHSSGTPLCPVDDSPGSELAQPVEGEAEPCLTCGQPTINALFCPDCGPTTDTDTDSEV